jgi:DNA primase
MSGWVNFKELRSKLDFEQVLRHYGVEVKRKGDQHHGFCPLPKHEGRKNSPSFSANLKKGIFQCFGCGAKGNILEFAALMEKINLEDGAAFREVALDLQRQFCASSDSDKPERGKPVREKTNPDRESRVTVVINAPLDFELKDLDREHPYLLNRGFTPRTIDHFGLGFCSRGLFKDRVVIPLHDHKGRLVGYAGRVVDDTLIDENTPRYRFPSSRERHSKVFEFRKTRFLYNGFRITAPVDDILVVEGFTSVWWLNQNGFPNVVATMGADCSERQAELIVSLLNPAARVWIVPDGDSAGERLAQSSLLLLSPHRLVRWIKLEKDKQPTDYPAAFYHECLR